MKDYRDLFVAPEQQEQVDPGELMRPDYVPPTPSGYTSYGDMWRALESRPERQGVPEWLGSYMGSDDLKKQQTAPAPAPTAAQPDTVTQSWSAPNEYEGQSGLHTNKTPEVDFARMASEADAKYAAERQAKSQPAKAAESNPNEHFKRSEQIDPMRGVVSITTPTVTVHEAQRFRTADDGSVFFRGADGEEYQMNPDDPNVQRAMAYDSRSAQPQAPAGDHWDAIRRAR